jgi:hypothetical protein
MTNLVAVGLLVSAGCGIHRCTKCSEQTSSPAKSVTSRQPMTVKTGLRGVFFNPNIKHRNMDSYPWPIFDPYGKEYRAQIRAALHDLAKEAGINFIDIFIPIPFTLARPPQANKAGQPLSEWANTTYLDNVAVFVDDCHDAGIYVELDLADNRWIPYSVDSQHHLGKPGGNPWPVADDTPWDESATWYSEIINYIESRTKHPENIAMWGMMGHYQLGTAEPDLWGNDLNPKILAYTEQFVKRVWPVFRSAGKRPKAAPYAFPFFANNAAKSPEWRLSGFSNLKKWLVDDLALPPDYWPMSTYPFCDPAPDGVYYLRRIVEILGTENASRIISTDFKGPGHDQELKESIISAGGHSGRDMLEWHFKKCAEYGFAGWWIYSYQDQEVFNQHTGIRGVDGQWKTDLLDVVKQQSHKTENL